MSTPERTVPSGRGGWRRTNAHRKLRYRSAALSARSFAQAVSRYRSRRVSTRPHRRGTGLDKLARFRSSARSEGRRCRIAAARCARVRGSAAADFCPVHRSREWAGSHVGEAQQRVADAKHVAGKAQGALSISADVNESAWRRWRALPLAPKPVSTESAVVEWQAKLVMPTGACRGAGCLRRDQRQRRARSARGQCTGRFGLPQRNPWLRCGLARASRGCGNPCCEAWRCTPRFARPLQKKG
jgi:hypothetical protein